MIKETIKTANQLTKDEFDEMMRFLNMYHGDHFDLKMKVKIDDDIYSSVYIFVKDIVKDINGLMFYRDKPMDKRVANCKRIDGCCVLEFKTL